MCLPCLCCIRKLLILFSIFNGKILALRCYTCSYVPTTGSRACIENPDKVEGQKFTNCNKKFCTIQRQELVVSICIFVYINEQCLQYDVLKVEGIIQYSYFMLKHLYIQCSITKMRRNNKELRFKA